MFTASQHRLIRNLSAIIICACILVATTLVDWVMIADQIRGLSFEPTAEMIALKNDLNLTTRGNTIFSSTHPTIKDREEFNRVCASGNSEVSILGCYDGQNIFVYNIDNSELAGIKQSTLAHELLHAAWSRLSIADRARLEPELEFIYEANFDNLQPRLELYPQHNFYEELHSIVGTEFADLSNYLETHYARYFNDQDTIVGFFNNYDTKFRELKIQAEALYEQININQEIIDAKVANYDDAFRELSAAIIDFNRRAESGYFTSVAAANAEREVLLARQNALEELYHEIVALVDDTNDLIEQYNNNIARTQLLLDSINSSPSPMPMPNDLAL